MLRCAVSSAGHRAPLAIAWKPEADRCSVFESFVWIISAGLLFITIPCADTMCCDWLVIRFFAAVLKRALFAFI